MLNFRQKGTYARIMIKLQFTDLEGFNYYTDQAKLNKLTLLAASDPLNGWVAIVMCFKDNV